MPTPSRPNPSEETEGDQLLADLLEACLRAEQDVPGSSSRIVASAPDEVRTDLEQLVRLGLRLWSLKAVRAAPALRQGPRTRIMRRLTELLGALTRDLRHRG